MLKKNKKHKKRKRGVVLKTVLKTLENGATEVGNIFLAFLSAGYGASLSSMEQELREIRGGNTSNKETKRQKRNFHTMMSRLKKEGLVEEVKSDGDKKLYKITRKGIEKSNSINKKLKNSLPTTKYKKEKSKDLTIVIFDIPEKERRKRDWLRSALQNLDFEMRQQSVWTGNSKIPAELIENIHNLKLDDYVEIFKAVKKGTLK